ncbi:tyrosine-type recombinase/integrase [Thalassotalea sp. PS06]|uniref:tyrosine-type recombinase/integrase n=1 Tax=Thalassotalea sp. PS06 TaxID=2594005 RepID=UPI001162AC41|nr:tyrosine-type recombinase/integrase [Thalassotalea sp. PS06]QDP01354.1 tyrosine-type recombinase/integrase [Thalassotalea sp. PS06]
MLYPLLPTEESPVSSQYNPDGFSMARKRADPADAWMPPRVYRGRSAFEFRARNGKTIRLCGLDSPKSQVWKNYEELDKRNLKFKDTFEKLLIDYYESPQHAQKKPATKQSYEDYKKDLLKHFGSMKARTIGPRHVRKFLDEKYERSGATQANRHKSALSVIFSWGFERERVERNPCVGIKKFKETPREVYIEDDDYKLMLKHADPPLEAAMEIAYLCMARNMDVRNLKKADCLQEGVYICQSKTNKKQIKRWGKRLRAAVKLCDQHFKSNNSLFVVHQEDGSKYSHSGLNNLWRKAKKKAEKELGRTINFTFHDIKAKGISDFEGSEEQKREAAGHTNVAQTRDYNRKTMVVDTVETASQEPKKKTKKP